MIVGFHSPLPPAPTGVADYSATLLSALRERGTVETGAQKADVHLYHLGNNPLHREIYRLALAAPGVAVLHDAVLQHFFLSFLEREAYIEEFVYNYGEWFREFGERLWNERAGALSDERYFQYPMLRRAAEASRAIVVHNAAAARAVRAHARQARVFQTPHLWTPPPGPLDAGACRFRKRMEIEDGAFVWTVAGYLRESKRLPVIFRAFDEVRRRGVNGVLVVAGGFVSLQLERALAPWFERSDVRRLGRLTAEDFWLLGAATDACISLRYPSAGETSGITIRMMGLGKPVIVTESEENMGFPEGACLPVRIGPTEESELAAFMEFLALNRDIAARIGQRAAEHVRERHSIRRVADAYWEILCGCCA